MAEKPRCASAKQREVTEEKGEEAWGESEKKKQGQNVTKRERVSGVGNEREFGERERRNLPSNGRV